jgi:phosphatidylethanolamine-binding protein (PEBP) family uncharacterized protein
MGKMNKKGNTEWTDGNSKVKISIIIFCIPEETQMSRCGQSEKRRSINVESASDQCQSGDGKFEWTGVTRSGQAFAIAAQDRNAEIEVMHHESADLSRSTRSHNAADAPDAVHRLFQNEKPYDSESCKSGIDAFDQIESITDRRSYSSRF